MVSNSIRQPVLKKILWFRNKVLTWYDIEGRHFPWRNKSATKYQIISAEILLQRTKAETVAGFYPLFFKQFPSWKALSHASKDEIGAFIKPIGLWRQRSRTLSSLSKAMVNLSERFPKTRKEIEMLPGVGQYIANAIEMFCNSTPRPLLDVNMARVLERFFGPRKLADIRYDPYLQKLSHRVISIKKAKELNWAILDFASIVCRSRQPLCKYCFLNRGCYFHRKNYHSA